MLDTVVGISQRVPPALIGAAVGALIGALTNAYLRHRSDRKVARQELVGAITTFTQECLAAIAEMYGASLGRKNEGERWKARAKFMSLYGRGMAIESRIFREFRDRRVRAGFHRVLVRLERLAEHVGQKEPLSAQQFDIGIHWVDHGLAEALSFTAKKAGIEVADMRRVAFVGLRRATPEDRRLLSFEEGPPPWVFHVSLDFAKSRPSPEESRMISENIYRKIGSMRCAEHGYAPHVTLHGRTSKSFGVQIEACCEAFVKRAYHEMNGSAASAAPATS